MPELPEVETTLRGIAPYVDGHTLERVVIRNASLRWPVPVDEMAALQGSKVLKLSRRAKYILIHFEQAVLMLHLGMSGSLRVVDASYPAAKHDHIDLVFGTRAIRFNDPRRFGCCLVMQAPIESHKLIENLGPEPLGDGFDGDYLFKRSRGKKVAVKNFIMDGQVVVGVGNIYASESLYAAGIRPTVAAQRVSRARYQQLAEEIKRVLAKAIEAGGTTLNDFTQADGKPGYFRHELQVYGRAGEPCHQCGDEIQSKVIGQRNTFYCRRCQK